MSACTITIHVTPHPALRQALTLEVASTMHEGFVRFLRQLPWEERGWDATAQRWWVHAKHRDALCTAALAAYDEVSLVDGRFTTDLRSGQVIEQLSLL